MQRFIGSGEMLLGMLKPFARPSVCYRPLARNRPLVRNRSPVRIARYRCRFFVRSDVRVKTSRISAGEPLPVVVAREMEGFGRFWKEVVGVGYVEVARERWKFSVWVGTSIGREAGVLGARRVWTLFVFLLLAWEHAGEGET